MSKIEIILFLIVGLILAYQSWCISQLLDFVKTLYKWKLEEMQKVSEAISKGETDGDSK